jgi:cytochrome c oxidase subunit 2
VPHGVVVEDLRIDLDIAKNQPGEITITPMKTGDFKGRCSTYCGGGHSAMTFVVHVASADDL